MTDVRLPERWLSDRRVLLTSPQAWRLYTFSLMYSVANRSDGLILPDDLQLMPTVDPDCAAELVKLGLWERCRDGWRVADFATTQSSRDELDQLERIRQAERDKKRRQRLKESTGQSPGQSPGTAQAGRQAGKAGRQALRSEGPSQSGSVTNSQNRRVHDGSEDPAPDDYVAHADLPVGTSATGSGSTS